MNKSGSESFRKTIKNRYGSRNLKQADNLQRCTTKRVRLMNHLKFLRRYRDNDIVPVGLRIRLPKDECKARNVKRMKTRLETTRVRSRIKDIRPKLYFVNLERREILTELKETFVDDDFEWLKQVIEIAEKKEHEVVKKRQIKKYNALVKEKEDCTRERKQKFEDQEKMKKDKIKNEDVYLTRNGIDDNIKKYLALGPDFCETPKKVPYEDIIAETEKMCTMIEKEGDNKEIGSEIIDREIREVRESVNHILKRAANRQYKTNLTKEELQGKKKALQDKTKVFLPADKGHIMVAMDKYENEGGEQSYEHKMKQVLVDLKAKTINKSKQGLGLNGKGL